MSLALLTKRAAKVVVLAAICWSGSGPAHADGPFAALPGSWSGTGAIVFNNGTRERIRCRADYNSEDGTTLRLELRCASDSYKFELTSRLTATGQSITGTWSENTRFVSGSINGRSTGTTINVTASSPTFTALLAVNTRGNRQNISIQSPGSEMSEVTIALARAAHR